MTATLVVSILPRYLPPTREFSAIAQSIESTSMPESVDPEPPGLPFAMTRKPCDAHSVRMFSNQVPSARGTPRCPTRRSAAGRSRAGCPAGR